jgi:hypothetical protein
MILINLENKKEIIFSNHDFFDFKAFDPLVLDLDLNQCPLRELGKILNYDNINSLNSYFSFFSILGMNRSELWNTIPDHVKNRYFLEISENIKKLDKSSLEYLFHLSKIKDFLRNFSRPNFDKNYFVEILESSGNFQKAKEIRENSKILDQKIEYSNSKTSTGRLTIVGGINVLTLPSDFKNSIRTSFEDGSIIQLDIISAEPKIAWKMAGREESIDVYERIAAISELSGLTREIAKQATICALYGQSSSNLSKILPLEINSKKLIENVKNILGFEKLISLQKKDGFYRNILGRPLKIENDSNHFIKVSHFLQSSAADISLLMFSDFCSRVDNRAIPLFVIHDALVVDCDKELSDYLKRKSIIKLKYGEFEMHAKITFIGQAA